MPNKKNIQNVKNLEERLQKYPSFILLDCTGLDVTSMNKFRRGLDSVDSLYRVDKNRLIKIALKDVKDDQLPINEEWLKGPTGLVFVNEDPISPIKIIDEFRSNTNGKPVIKGLYIDGQEFDSKHFDTLAKLPGVEQMKAQVIGVLQQPICDLVNVFNNMISNFLSVLSQIKEGKE